MIYRSVRAAALGAASITALGMSLAAVTAAPALAQDAAAAAAASDRVVVTGSRIARRDFQANSPIVTVNEDTFQDRSSFSIESALNQLPQFTPSGSESLSSSAGTPFPGAAAAPGAATLNLRSLGANRSLILVNGRRAQPVNATMLVDINQIPSAAVQNVEVITGGAAAVYGADAIAGVVNFILKDDFEGFEVDAQYGITERGDNEGTQVSVLVGGNFGDGRGNAMLGASWSQRGPAYAREREFYTRAWTDVGTTGGAVGNTGLMRASIAGVQWGVNPDGTLFNTSQPLNPNPARPAGVPASAVTDFGWPLNGGPDGSGFRLAPGGTGYGALGWADYDQELNVPLTRYSLFGSANYQLTDRINFFLEGSFTESVVEAQSLVPEAFDTWALSIPYNQANDDPDSPTFGATPRTHHPVSRQLADLLNARGTNPAGVPGTMQPWSLNMGLDFLGRLRTKTTSTVYQLAAGLEGELPVRDWTWEVYGSHGQTTINAGNWGVSQRKLQQIFNNSTTAQQTTPNSATSTTGPWSAGWSNGEVLAVVGSCTSGIPLFNANGTVNENIQLSQDCIDYASLNMNNLTSLTQDIVEGSLQGGLLDIWAGEVRFAVGAQYREVDFLFNPDSSYTAQQERPNVIGLISLPQATTGYIAAKEVYGELLVPLLADIPFIQQLDLELGARYSDYSTAGGIWTYKILGDWSVNDWLRFRGGYQLANRAPNINELYAPVSSQLTFNSDPCANMSATPAWGNVAANPNRVNVQLACAELIRRDGGYNYRTLATDPNPGEPPANFPALDQTHMSNFRYQLFAYNNSFPFTLALQQGNPNLDSEEAETWTAGAVINSPISHALLDRLSLSVDWYSIDLTGTIGIPTGPQVYSQCLDAQYNDLIGSAAGTLTGAQILEGNDFCALINREPIDQFGVAGVPGSGRDRNYDAAYMNQGGTRTSGIDVQVNWGADFADLGAGFIPGSFNWNVVTSVLLNFEESPFPGAPYVEYKGTVVNSAYDYQVLSTFNYLVGDFSVGLRTQYLPAIDRAPTSAATTLGAEPYTRWDMFGRYRLSDAYEVRAGIDNLFDEDPEVVGRSVIPAPGTGNNALSTTNQNYDTLGRRFYVGFTARY